MQKTKQAHASERSRQQAEEQSRRHSTPQCGTRSSASNLPLRSAMPPALTAVLLPALHSAGHRCLALCVLLRRDRPTGCVALLLVGRRRMPAICVCPCLRNTRTRVCLQLASSPLFSPWFSPLF